MKTNMEREDKIRKGAKAICIELNYREDDEDITSAFIRGASFADSLSPSVTELVSDEEINKMFPEDNECDPNNGIEDCCYPKRQGAIAFRDKYLTPPKI